jgi:hypothetical protein
MCRRGGSKRHQRFLKKKPRAGNCPGLLLYNPRHPERTLLYQTVAEHYETWLDLASAGQYDGLGDHHTPKPYVRKAFAKYLECGIFAHDFLVAFSCKGRGVCPSCNARRMAETAAHLTDHVFPRLPVRQWVLWRFVGALIHAPCA